MQERDIQKYFCSIYPFSNIIRHYFSLLRHCLEIRYKKDKLLSFCTISLMYLCFWNYFNILRVYFFPEPWESQEKNEKQVPGHLYATAIENLRPFTQYKARIKATNNLGTGPPSSVIAVKNEICLEIRVLLLLLWPRFYVKI